MKAKGRQRIYYAGDNNQVAPVVVGSLAELAALLRRRRLCQWTIKTEVKIGETTKRRGRAARFRSRHGALHLAQPGRAVATRAWTVLLGTTTPQAGIIEIDDRDGNRRTAQRERPGAANGIHTRRSGKRRSNCRLRPWFTRARFDIEDVAHGPGPGAAQPEPGRVAGGLSPSLHPHAFRCSIISPHLTEPCRAVR